MTRHIKPVVLFTPGGVEQDVDRDFSASYVDPGTAEPCNPTADQMVRGEYLLPTRPAVQVTDEASMTAEIIDPKDETVTEPVTIPKAPTKVPPVNPAKKDASS